MADPRLLRWMALSGVVGMVLVFLGFVVLGGDSPTEDATSSDIIAFYRDNLTKARVSGLLVAIGAVLLVFFGGALRNALRGSDGGDDAIAAVAFAGVVLLSGGLLLGSAIHFSLVAAADNHLDEAARALNIVDQNDFYPMIGGASVMLLASGIATIRRPMLPRWLAWMALVVGILALAGPLGIVGFALSPVWVIIVSIMLFRKAGAPESATSSL